MATVAYSIAVNQIYKLLNIQKRSMLVVTDNPEPDLEHDEQQSPPPEFAMQFAHAGCRHVTLRHHATYDCYRFIASKFVCRIA